MLILKSILFNIQPCICQRTNILSKRSYIIYPTNGILNTHIQIQSYASRCE